MKIFIALISSLIMFALTLFIILSLILPILPFSEVETIVGAWIISIAVGVIIAGFVAVYTFRASLKAKTGKLYRKENTKDSIDNKI